ncbi:hypothetical protein LCGC14_2174510 [marine sediment metagenome]|uniref:Uncharacterized protein n=1 Tax=marine sediment metagenome TaxID=412755 RepID=A0A0F9G1S1_9ZZZZ
MTVQWKIVDAIGDLVMSAESIAHEAERQRTTPVRIARAEAKMLSDPISGEVFAVKA